MPRYATATSLEVLTARNKLRMYLGQEGHSESELARRSGVPQYAISRFVNGRTKSLTPNVRAMLDYANIGIEDDVGKLCNEPIIKAALTNAWDGTALGIERIATALNALAPLLRSTP